MRVNKVSINMVSILCLLIFLTTVSNICRASDGDNPNACAKVFGLISSSVHATKLTSFRMDHFLSNYPLASKISKMKNWSEDTIFFRSLNAKYLAHTEDGTYFVSGNPNSMAKIVDIYSQTDPSRINFTEALEKSDPRLLKIVYGGENPVEPLTANMLSQPSLNVFGDEVAGRLNDTYGEIDGDLIIISIKLIDLIEAGAMPYPDLNYWSVGSTPVAWIFTIPKGTFVPVTVIRP